MRKSYSRIKKQIFPEREERKKEGKEGRREMVEGREGGNGRREGGGGEGKKHNAN
jgi:hypothetical protein